MRSVMPAITPADRERRREPPVVETVVLRDHGEVPTLLVGPAELLERGGVDVGGRRGSEGGRPEVVAHHEHRHGGSFGVGAGTVRVGAGSAGEERADFVAEARHLVAELVDRPGGEAQLQV